MMMVSEEHHGETKKGFIIYASAGDGEKRCVYNSYPESSANGDSPVQVWGIC